MKWTCKYILPLSSSKSLSFHVCPDPCPEGPSLGANYDMRRQLSWPLLGYARLGHPGRVESVTPGIYHHTIYMLPVSRNCSSCFTCV